jgi:hypothetical protein
VRYGLEGLSQLLITVIDARFLPFKATLASVEEYKQKILRQDGLETRLSLAYAAQVADPGVHLVYGFFPWGPFTINVLIRLRRLVPSDFRPLSTSIIAIL